MCSSACSRAIRATPGRAIGECARAPGNREGRRGAAVRGVPRQVNSRRQPHHHMPSHTFNEVGRRGDSVRANIEAWHSDLKAAAGEGFAIYPSHNLHMLVYAAAMDGQGAIAMRAGRDYATLVRGDSMFQVLTLIRFGRFDECRNITMRPQPDIAAGAWSSRTATRGCGPVRLTRQAHTAAPRKVSEAFAGHHELWIAPPRGTAARCAGRHPRRGDSPKRRRHGRGDRRT